MRLLRILPGLIFGLFFTLGGIFITSQTAWPTWKNWYAMQQWQPSQAKLLDVSGSDTETLAHYRYSIDGITYQGNRVYVADFNDNIGSYQGDLQRRLHAQMNSGRSIPVWVNPSDPHQSVIDRDMRWGLFALVSGFCSVFIVIGLLVIYASLRSKSKGDAFTRPSLSALRREWKEKQKNPDFNESSITFSQQRTEVMREETKGEPRNTDWQNRKGWQSELIGSKAKSGMAMMWLFAVFWNGVSSPLLFAFPEEWERENYAIAIGLLFPLIGAFLLYKAVVMTLEYRRFGKVLYKMDPFPGATGGHVGGWVHVPHLAHKVAIGLENPFSVRLECVYTYMSGSGKNRSRRENIKWAEEGQPHLESAGHELRLAFRFDVPDNLPEAEVAQTGSYHFWRLTVKADLEGVDLHRQYNIPVFHTGESSRYVRHDLSAQVAAQKDEKSKSIKDQIALGNFDLPGLSRAMHLSKEGGEITLSFPMFRNKALTLFAAVFAGGFGFGSYSMMEMAFNDGMFGILIGLFGIPFFLVALVASIATIYLPFNNLHVQIGMNQITVLRRLLFIPLYYRRIGTKEISHLTIKRSGSTGQGVDKIEHFKVLVHDQKGASVTLAEDIDGEDTATHFRNYLSKHLNLSTSS